MNCFMLARYAEMHEGLVSLQGGGLNRFYETAFPAQIPLPIFLVIGIDEDPELVGFWEIRIRQKDADGRVLLEAIAKAEISAERPLMNAFPFTFGFPTPGDYVLEMEATREGLEAWERVARKTFKAEIPRKEKKA